MRQRHALIDSLRAKGIWDARVLDVMRQVPRHQFTPEDVRAQAYRDRALPIGLDQTISQPYIVALMSQALRLNGSERVLEVGTGSGYQTAILSRLARQVYTVEIRADLSERAQQVLQGCRNVRFRVGDGWAGWPEAAPFDAVVVTAAPPSLPLALMEQLRIGGRMVVPIGEAQDTQTLWVLRKTQADVWTEESLGPVVFVPRIEG
jgi:protein-L-isoaspartate(D-aspartate) O-methyltransferase